MHEPGHEGVVETGVSGDDASNKNDNLLSDDLSDVRMDLTDDLLHMVFICETTRNIFLDHIWSDVQLNLLVLNGIGALVLGPC